MQRFCHFREKRSSIPGATAALRGGVVIAVFSMALAFPAPAQTAPADEGASASASKKCETLKRRIAKEQSSLASFDQTIATDRKGRETCSTKPMCTRYDDAIKTMEARKAEHEARLAKFRSDADSACKSS